MKKLVLILLMLSTSAIGAVIPKSYNMTCDFPFSNEQIGVLKMAHDVGYDYRIENTIQAMVIKESFIWSNIDRVREVSPSDTSYGVTHFRPTTAAWLLVKFGMSPDFITADMVGEWLKHPSGDALSINLTRMYMTYKMQEQGKSWRRAIGEYNAGSNWNTSGVSYTNDVIQNVKYLEKCWKYHD